ncbi:hypothetical protein, partial [Citrobacter portucalensis]|uniref:hypothetical protein n=1 Tax=Citrobacter portucalensis TaxID=1639133 RepID=UPI000B12F7AB
SLKTSIKTITNLSDTNCLEIQGASLTSTKQKCKKHRNGKTEIVINPIKILNSHRAKLSPIPQLTYQRVHDV